MSFRVPKKLWRNNLRQLLLCSPRIVCIRAFRLNSSSSLSSNRYDGEIKSSFSNLSLPNEDICSLLFSRWEKWPEKCSLECISTGRKLTFGKLLDYSLRWGGALQKICPNIFESSETLPKVTIFSPNEIEYVPICIGTLAAGWIFSTINSNYKVYEAKHILKDVHPNVLVVHSSLESVAEEALKSLKMSIPVLSIGASKHGNPNIQDIIEDENTRKIETKPIDPTRPAFILYSGGTTGLPKGVVLPHSSVVNNIICFTDPRIHAFGWEEFSHVTVTSLMPFYHVYGLYVQLMINLYLGSKQLVFQHFNPSSYGGVVQDHKIQFLHLVPTLLNFIINSGQVKKEHLSTVRGAVIGAGSVLPSAAHEFRRMTSENVIFQEGFGMTEVLGSHLTPKDSVRIGFCGKVVPNTEAKIRETVTGKTLGPNQPGELCIRSPSLMSEYWNNPEATSEAFEGDGWFRTGDVASYTEDGYFSIIDRIKDIMKVKSFQVSPAEVEDALMEHEAVVEAGVVGVPDKRHGELPRAYVVVNNEKVTAEEIMKHIENRLAPYKRLTGGVRFLKELPKNQAGKLLRKDLKELVKKDTLK